MLKQYCTTSENHLKFCSNRSLKKLSEIYTKRFTMLDDLFM